MAEAGHFSVPDEVIIDFCLNEYECLKFLPSHAQIFGFLTTKNRDPSDSSVQFIKEIDLLNHEPWELPRLSSRGHYFCKPERYGNGKWKKRSTKSGSGYWEQGGKAMKIEGFVVRRTLRFYKYVYEHGKKKAKRTGNMIYEYELPDFDFEKNSFVMIRLEECEAGSGEPLASNAVNSPTENTLPQLPNVHEGELSTFVKSETAAGSGALPPPIDQEYRPFAFNGVNIDDMSISQLNTSVQSVANPIAPPSDINFRVSIEGIDAILTGNTNAMYTGNTNTNDAYEFSVPLPQHVSVPVVQESSVDNHTSLSDLVCLSQHSTSIFDTEVRDAFGPQVDPRLVVESETQAGGGARPPPDDQEYTGNTYPEANYEWVDGLFDF